MPAYDFRCRTCDTTFEVRRSLTEVAGAPPCPDGHAETTRVFSAVAVGGAAAPAPAGGCCGGGCCG